MLNTPSFDFSPIGVIDSPYKEKFAIPRQPGLITDGEARLHFLAPYNHPDIVRGLDQFSHIWLIFQFHQVAKQRYHTTVRPPRLGGNQRIGIFATRSPFRPNPIGLSLVKLNGIHHQSGQLSLALASTDLVDGTPILDIKPYLPFAESIPDAEAGFAQCAPIADLPVRFSAAAEHVLEHTANEYPYLRRFISEVLQQDPRPAYHAQQITPRKYAVHLLDFNICWQVENGINYVIAIDRR